MHGREENSYIWIFWCADLHVTHLKTTFQSISVTIKMRPRADVLATFIYASCYKRIRESLQADLGQCSSRIDKSWLVEGDFNALINISEKQCGRLVDVHDMFDFHNCIKNTGLMDAGFCGHKYTWCNNCKGGEPIRQRLDRVLYNDFAQDGFPNFTVDHLERVYSNQATLLLNFYIAATRASVVLHFNNFGLINQHLDILWQML